MVIYNQRNRKKAGRRSVLAFFIRKVIGEEAILMEKDRNQKVLLITICGILEEKWKLRKQIGEN